MYKRQGNGSIQRGAAAMTLKRHAAATGEINQRFANQCNSHDVCRQLSGCIIEEYAFGFKGCLLYTSRCV